MQTFLPYTSFRQSAASLDDVRLRKQILECEQIVNAIERGTGWKNHPVTKQWTGFLDGLYSYARCCLAEYRKRCGTKFVNYDAFFGEHEDIESELPWWLADKHYHAGQRGHLYRKDPAYYAKFKQDENSPLLYPVNDLECLVERVDAGKFRKFPNGVKIYKSVIDAAKGY